MKKVPTLIQSLFPDIIWRIPNNEGKVFLTFDDGPDPEVTPKILDLLNLNGAKATFFCLGEQVEKHPDCFTIIKENGHGLGNHGFSHLDGFRTSKKNYLLNFDKGYEYTQSPIFRPPFGRLRFSQKNHIQKKHTIVLWDLMAKDYDAKAPVQKVINFLTSHILPGSIICQGKVVIFLNLSK